MTERGTIFSGPSIPALLSGAKTETRRVMNPQPYPGPRQSVFMPFGWEDGYVRELKPLHRPGDVVWIREAWRTAVGYDHLKPTELPEYALILHSVISPLLEDVWGRYRSALHLPKRFARPWRGEILESRPERVRDITEAGAIAEGFASLDDFLARWDEIHKPAKDMWGNRWVWVYRFAQVETPA